MHTYRCTILRVVDGDTVDVDIDLGFGVWNRGERIRVLGIDTPETRTRDLTEKVYGNLAKNFVKDYLPVGSTQILQTEKDSTGKFGRILGDFDVYCHDTDSWRPVTKIMIEEHHAVPYHGQSKQDIFYEHLANREKLFKSGIVPRG